MYVTALAVLLPTLLLHSYYARADTLPDGTIYWITSSTSPDAPVQSQHVTACQNNTVAATPLNQTYIDGMQSGLKAYSHSPPEGSWAGLECSGFGEGFFRGASGGYNG